MPPQPGTPWPSTVLVCSPASPLVSRPLLCPGVMETETLSDCPVWFLGCTRGPRAPAVMLPRLCPLLHSPALDPFFSTRAF